MAKFHSVLYLLITFTSSLLGSKIDDRYTLKAVSVIFRHGDRTPEKYPEESYYSDPYINETYHPFGNGQLTSCGRKRSYQLGTYLRKRYNNFLSYLYAPSEIAATSSNKIRSEESMMRVLEALYPPKIIQVFNHSLPWPKSKPIHTADIKDLLYIRPELACKKFLHEAMKTIKSAKYTKEASQFREFFKKLQPLINEDMTYITAFNLTFKIFQTLTAQKAMKLPLPDWTKLYFPNGSITDIALFAFKTMSYTDNLKKLNGGSFMRKVLNDIKDTKVKIHLYSVHDSNISALLYILLGNHNILPRYSSAVILEWYKSDANDFVKVLYYAGIPSKHEELTIPNCSLYCPVATFLKILKDVLPEDIVEQCETSSRH